MAADIRHVVVLMLENRSFDSMLGRLYQSGPNFDGLTGAESNPWQGHPVSTWTGDSSTQRLMHIPDPNPGESFVDMNEQIFGAAAPQAANANMSGFVSNYMRHGQRDPKIPMHGFSPEHVPVITALARSFGVSDRWHASTPNQTWPNRFFVHTGTGGGYVDNRPGHAPFGMRTIFKRLTDAKRSWRIYRHDVSHAALTLHEVWGMVPDHLCDFDPDFPDDCAEGSLPNYSFIEPSYYGILTSPPNDQHPTHDVGHGERLIARCYQALRRSPAWEHVLFVVTYDEHGGIYDHVPPPQAVPPDNFAPDGFHFDRYGVRVPAVLISPWIPAGSIVRPPTGAAHPFDHTSILSTLRKLFSLGAPLTARDAAAPDLLHALSLAAPTNSGPAHLTVPMAASKTADLAAHAASPPNDLQVSLAQASVKLPTGAANVPEHLSLLSSTEIPLPKPKTVDEARQIATANLQRFVGRSRRKPAQNP